MATRSSAWLLCWVTAYLAAASGASAQAPVRRIRQKMTDSLSNTPDFVCAVTIERTERMGRGAPVKLLPLGAITGMVNGKEVFALPSSEEEKTRLREVLAVFDKAGTGSFAVYSRAVFLTDAATFYDVGDETKDGQRLSREDFTMPRETSTYTPNMNGKTVTLGYSGSIWTEPGGVDVARLALQADNIPPDLGIKAVTQTFEYGHARMAGATVVVPAAMGLTLTEQSGRETRLTAQFSDCHQYLAKRGDLFVETAPGPPAAPAKGSGEASAPKASSAPEPSGPLLPAKLILDTILAESIDERTMTPGSNLSFTILKDVKKGGKVIVPKGAPVAGHITRIIQQEYSWMTSLKRYYLVGLQLDSVVVEDQRFRVLANLDSLGPPYNFPAVLPSIPSFGFVPYSNDPYKWGTWYDSRSQFIIPPVETGESFIGVVNEFLRLPDHLKMYWDTVAPPK